MRYMVLLYGDETAGPAEGSPEAQVEMAEYFALDEALDGVGKIDASEALHPTAQGTTLRTRDGEVVTLDGPFAETREQLGGFYLIDVPDLDAAIAFGARIPAVRAGAVEIRPVMEFG